jgi:uncharacterized RDD family membrane protein YckC
VATSAPLDTDVAIETAEHIVFRYRVAGPARRLLAYALDLVFCYGAFAIVAELLVAVSLGAERAAGVAEQVSAASVGIVLVMLFAAQWVYFAAFEGWRGRTPGKAVFGLAVVSTTGRPVGPRAAVLRNVLRAADALPLAYTAGLASVAALLSMTMTKRFQRLGDLVAGTMVVVPDRALPMAPVVLWPPAQPGEAEALPEEVRLDAEERQAIEMFLRRRARLGRARELELAAMIAPMLGARFGSRAVSDDPARALALYYHRDAGGEARQDARNPGPAADRTAT